MIFGVGECIDDSKLDDSLEDYHGQTMVLLLCMYDGSGMVGR